MPARWPVVAFDLDGTLLPGTSVSRVTAEWLGRHGALDELEDRYAAGEISNAEIATTSAGWFAGRTPQDVAAALERAPWIAGIQETVAALRAAGTYVVLATVTWRFVAAMVGDSRSDLPSFRVCGLSIALNGDQAARAAATTSLSTDDLRAVLPLLS